MTTTVKGGVVMVTGVKNDVLGTGVSAVTERVGVVTITGEKGEVLITEVKATTDKVAVVMIMGLDALPGTATRVKGF
jgi:hypothetical protein